MDISVATWIVLLGALALVAIGAVVIPTLPLAAVLLAITAILLAMVLFVLGMTLAAVMELSVCAGLVTALFASAIALLKPLQEDDQTVRVRRSRIWRFVPLPFILVGATVVIVLLLSQLDLDTLSTMILYRPGAYQSVQAILWNRRALDILAMALLILTGVLGVATLLKQRERK